MKEILYSKTLKETDTEVSNILDKELDRQKNQIENLNILLTNHSWEEAITTIELRINGQQKSIHNIEIPANSKITHNLHYINPNDTDFINGLIKSFKYISFNYQKRVFFISTVIVISSLYGLSKIKSVSYQLMMSLLKAL